MGTPEFSVPVLESIIGDGHEVVALYTQPPRPAKRGQHPLPSPVAQTAQRYNIPVFTPESFRDKHDIEIFKSHDAHVAIVVAYGLLLPEEILSAPLYGCLNIHASLLPRWRGAAPIQRAIMAGDKQSGVMIMKMEKGLDTGPIGLVDQINITDSMTANQLHDVLSLRGADLIIRALAALERDSLIFTPQSEEGITYAAKIQKSEAKIDWNQSAETIRNHIHGLSPFPGAYVEMEIRLKKERIKILKAKLSDDSLKTGQIGGLNEGKILIGTGDSKAIEILELQKSGKSPMSVPEFLNGAIISAEFVD